MNRIIIADLLPSDYEDMISLWKKAGLPYKPLGRDKKKNILQQLKEPNNFFLKATENNKIIGVVIASHNQRKGWINRLAIDPHYQRQGLATKLIVKAQEYLQNAGINIVACLIEDWNKTSIEFFQKNNFILHKDIYYFTRKTEENI